MTIEETKPLGQLLRCSPRYGINAAAVPLAQDTPTYLRITDIDSSGRFAPDPKVGVAHPNALSYRLQPGEMVFARTGASVGKSYLYSPRDGELIYAGFLINVAPDPAFLNPKFLSLVVQTKEYWDWIARTSVRSGQPGINGRELASLPIPIVHISNQDAIANAMTDVDDMVETLERMITKKQSIKQGMMQQLLTGEIRLSGHSGDWAELTVAPKSTIKARIGWQGLKADEYRTNGNYRLVGGTEFADGSINWDQTSYVDKWRFDQDQNIQLCEGDVLLTKDGTIGKTAYVDSLPGPTTLNSGVFVIRPLRNAYDPQFLYFMLRSRYFADFLARLSAGSTISHLYQRDLVTLVLRVPPTLAEQRAIASALADAESEIAKLRQQLDKARATKRGMMQELLTGRTRLKPTETAL